MSDQDIIDTIADVLRQAELRPIVQSPSGRAGAVLAALRDAGYAIVKLPEPSEYTDDRGRMYNTYPFVGVKSDDITVGATCEFVYHINQHEARATGLALLAAADYAEAVTQI